MLSWSRICPEMMRCGQENIIFQVLRSYRRWRRQKSALHPTWAFVFESWMPQLDVRSLKPCIKKLLLTWTGDTIDSENRINSWRPNFRRFLKVLKTQCAALFLDVTFLGIANDHVMWGECSVPLLTHKVLWFRFIFLWVCFCLFCHQSHTSCWEALLTSRPWHVTAIWHGCLWCPTLFFDVAVSIHPLCSLWLTRQIFVTCRLLLDTRSELGVISVFHCAWTGADEIAQAVVAHPNKSENGRIMAFLTKQCCQLQLVRFFDLI